MIRRNGHLNFFNLVEDKPLWHGVYSNTHRYSLGIKLGDQAIVLLITHPADMRCHVAVEVITTDIKASNGVIHVIDTVLLPPEPVTIVDAAIADGRFTTLVAAVKAAGLVDALSGEDMLTVFAPTDDAFAALPEGTIDALLAEPEGQLTDILLYHVVDGAVPAADVVTLESFSTLLGQDVTVTLDDSGNVFLNDEVQIIITDIETDNGIIHVIDTVLLPIG